MCSFTKFGIVQIDLMCGLEIHVWDRDCLLYKKHTQFCISFIR